MNKLQLSLATLLLLSLPLRAQIVAGSASEAAAWVGPMASAVSAAGSERIAGLGFTSLTALSRLDENGRYPFVAAPQVLAPLAAAVRAQGIEPAAFAALPTTEKLAVLSRAAAPAEARAAQAADEATSAVAEPIGIGTYDDVSRKVADARAVSLYLPAERAEAVAAAAEAVAAYKQKRAELMDDYIRQLPAKIAAGAFDGGNLIGRDRDGWYAADEHPNARHESLEKLYVARLQRIAQGPAGPWTVAEYELLQQTLENPRNLAALDEAWTSERGGSKGSVIPSLRLKREIAALHSQAREWASQTPPLRAAAVGFGADAPRRADFTAVDKFYLSALEGPHRFRFDWAAQARIISAIRTGDIVLPSWDRIQELRREAQRRYNKNAIISMFAFFGGMLAEVGIAISHAPAAVQFLAFAAIFAPMVWMFVNIWRRDEFHFDADSIDLRLRNR